MQTIHNCSPLQHNQRDTSRLMLTVIFACLPGIGISTWFFGFGTIVNILLAAAAAIAFEASILKLRGRSLRLHLTDNSALLTAVLFGIAIPPGSSWWLVVCGIFFAIVICKQSFGGLGQNLFNPAMAGYVFLLISFPLEMTTWHIPSSELLAGENFSPFSWPGLQQSISLSLPMLAIGAPAIQEMTDGLAMATPLIEHKMAASNAVFQAQENGLPLFARSSNTGWELTNMGYLVGGLFLLYKRVISWHIPLSLLMTVAIFAALLYEPGSTAVYGTPYLHLFGSATMLAAFFIATDPVSAATTKRGQIIYGVIIGLSIYSIRVWGSYLDSVAIAVLFGNFCVPVLDHFCRPRLYGHTGSGDGN